MRSKCRWTFPIDFVLSKNLSLPVAIMSSFLSCGEPPKKKPVVAVIFHALSKSYLRKRKKKKKKNTPDLLFLRSQNPLASKSQLPSRSYLEHRELDKNHIRLLDWGKEKKKKK
jgi:hypothetical protein